MRPILALVLTAGLALARSRMGGAAPRQAGHRRPQDTQDTQDPAHPVSAASTPKTRPATAGPKNGPKAGTTPGRGTRQQMRMRRTFLGRTFREIRNSRLDYRECSLAA